MNINPQYRSGVAAAANFINATISGFKAISDPASKYILRDGICITNFTVPDEKHLRMMAEQIAAGQVTFPYYTWHMSAYHKATLANAIDCSYSGSRIDRTYITFVNSSGDGSHDPKYEIQCANYKTSAGGVRAYHKIKRIHTDIQGTKFPSADGLTDAGPALIKAYNEHLEKQSVGQLCDFTHTNFYTLFDYTGAQNIFAIPTIQTESGEKVANRFINLRVEFAESTADISAVTGDRRIIVWHMAKKIMTWGSNMAMDVLE